MFLIILSLCIYLTGAILSARTLSRNEIKKFWRYNIIIVLLGIGLLFLSGSIYSGFDALAFFVPQVYAFTAYPTVVALVALIIGIRKGWNVTIVWAALCLLLGVGLFAAMFQNL